MQIEHEVDEARVISKTPHLGEVRTRKYLSTKEGVVEVEEVRTEDMLGHRQLQVNTAKWRASKIAWRNYGDHLGKASEEDKTDVQVVIAGGLPD